VWLGWVWRGWARQGNNLMAFRDFKTKRPSISHPDVNFWQELKQKTLELQGNQCATCPASAEDYPLDLHHRHYDNFGKEEQKDVVILCRLCHDAITSRLRSVRDRFEIKHELSTANIIEEIMSYDKPKF
jgi:5-methylcytosine-specific restriction endonuclease McrA